jgi:hypothetical protein
MKRFWISWWTANNADRGVTKWPPSLVIWVSGQRGDDDDQSFQESMCAVIDTDKTEADIWAALRSWFPDLEERFCSLEPQDFQPGDRFKGYDPQYTTIEMKPRDAQELLSGE